MERFDAKAYQQRVNERIPRSRTLQSCLRAFWTGGLICCVGQGIGDALRALFVLTAEEVAAWTAILLVFLGALIFLGTTLTGLGVYDRIGKYAGAGSVVPITGFANAMVAPAIEFRQEGLVTGVGAKMFSIAGPVIVFGVSASVLAGLLSLLFV